MRGERIVVNDLMQQGYEYLLTAPMGRDFHADFKPELTPAEMLRLGDLDCRRKQRQSLLHWAYDSRKI